MKRDRDRTKPEPLGRDPKGSAPDATAVAPLKPLKPRPGLFVALFLFFLVWVGVLLALWFFTIHRKG